MLGGTEENEGGLALPSLWGLVSISFHEPFTTDAIEFEDV
jgi:hypothetical protein